MGPFGKITQIKGDELTPHHMPSAEFMVQRHGVHPNRSLAMNLEAPKTGGRHTRTESFGRKPFLDETPRTALARDLWDVRRILRQDRVYGPQARQAFREFIELSKRSFPELFEK